MVEKKSVSILTVIVISLVVAVIASVATISLTGNSILIKDTSGLYAFVYKTNEVYNKTEIDAKFKQVGSTCQMLDTKNYEGMSATFACSKVGMFPKVIVYESERTLYNRQNCLSGYNIFYLAADWLSSDVNTLLVKQYGNSCANSLFVDGTSNGGFSTGLVNSVKGVICCR